MLDYNLHVQSDYEGLKLRVVAIDSERGWQSNQYVIKTGLFDKLFQVKN